MTILEFKLALLWFLWFCCFSVEISPILQQCCNVDSRDSAFLQKALIQVIFIYSCLLWFYIIVIIFDDAIAIYCVVLQ